MYWNCTRLYQIATLFDQVLRLIHEGRELLDGHFEFAHGEWPSKGDLGLRAFIITRAVTR